MPTILNAMTGLSISESSAVHESSVIYLNKLIEMEKAGTLYLVGLAAAMKKVRLIRN
ncbi:hypothetical protein BN2497_2553 [Janthinobacterium sp. CG23_2]|nr:hypothetical protein BN2497_29 [Janthinobacterium sp. CG23_2]CUI03888.1 hypothetical protein BN2497_2553 [Janthinobacterium sp. CG23_2]CUU26412.1 hypothetical protein BN3177_29 [Janthinobacterium sp. CG23_2]CUU27674.1 hypothetical protein BN3177_2553 [Janthinobacterium sp. CG23_2]